MIKLIVGLGNPGLQYQRTRHNAGFLFLDGLVSVNSGDKWQLNRQFLGDLSCFSYYGGRVIALKPVTYMNKSGLAVEKVISFYKIKPEEILVIHDELELSVGQVKMKFSGGHAGHNGLRDIIARIGSANFYRLRIGVGRPSVGSVADYVLSTPSFDEQQAIDKVCRVIAVDARELFLGEFDVFNQRFS